MSESQYVIVTDDENEQPMELPAEMDGTLLLSTLSAQFSKACGLKYFNVSSNSHRGVRLANGRLYPPDGIWGSRLYVCVFPKDKEDSKRKAEDIVVGPAAKSACTEKKCSDLIVLGLPYKSTEDDIKAYFSQFGDLVLVQIKRDPMTNNSKGFAFIRYASFDSQIKCMSQRHFLEGRWCDVRIPNSKDGSQSTNRKIFVGRCTEEMTTDDLRSFFIGFGEVIDVYIPKPFRGFAFVTFADPAIAQSLLGEDFQIRGTCVHVSSATPKQGVETGRPGVGYGYNNRDPVNVARGWQHHQQQQQQQQPPQYQVYQQQRVGMSQDVIANMGTFSEAVISAAQTALAQQGWGSFIDAVMPSKGFDGRQQSGHNSYGRTGDGWQ